MLLPCLPFKCLLVFDLASAQGAGGEAMPIRRMPPASAGYGKAPKDGFIFVKQDDLAVLGLLLEVSEVKTRLSELLGVRIESPGGAVITQAPLFNTLRMVSGCKTTSVC